MGKRFENFDIIISIALVGIPTAVDFYPPIIANIIDYIPSLLFHISGGFLAGWVAHDRVSRISTKDRVDGCLSLEGLTFRGSATFIDGVLQDIEVDPDPVCPNCQTRLERDKIRKGKPTGPSYSNDCVDAFLCSNCGHTKGREGGLYTSAENIFRMHFEKMGDSEGPFSLKTLKQRCQDKHGEQPTGRDIWRTYIKLADNDNLSTDCFID